MSNFDKAVGYVLELEGHISNHPDDPGGLTAFGITQRDNPDLFENGRMPDVEDAIERYESDYWVEDWEELPVLIACELLEASVLCGPRNAIKFAQNAVNFLRIPGNISLSVDGAYGPLTHRALKFAAGRYAEALYAAMNYYQAQHFDRVSKNNTALESFVRGWFGKRLGYDLPEVY